MPDREPLPLNYDDPATKLLLFLIFSEATLVVFVIFASFFKAISSIQPLDAFVTVVLCHAVLYRPYITNLLTSAPEPVPTTGKVLTEKITALESLLAYAVKDALPFAVFLIGGSVTFWTGRMNEVNLAMWVVTYLCYKQAILVSNRIGPGSTLSAWSEVSVQLQLLVFVVGCCGVWTFNLIFALLSVVLQYSIAYHAATMPTGASAEQE